MTTLLSTGFYPFWFWNDMLTADEIHWQVQQMAAQGVKGFFIHPRQGLQQPYLSAAFFEMVDCALSAAREHGLLVHLCDEYPYPSGVAGGEVVLGCPQYCATDLVHESHIVEGGRVRLALPRGKVLSCVAYPLVHGETDWERGVDLAGHVGMILTTDSYLETGLTAYNQKRYFASEPTPELDARLPSGQHKLLVSVQVEVEHHKYWNQFVDVLNPEAVARFIQLTHERYRERYGDQFGEQIVSIFVDETTPGWSDRLPSAFRDEYGYDLIGAMPALQDSDHPQHVRVSYDLHRLRYRLFCQSFEEPIAAWCQANGLAYSGEKPSLRLAQLKYMDIPGCEPGHTKAGARPDLLQVRVRGNARATASAAYFYGKAGALCECYHSMGWSANLQDAKLIADGLLLMGIKYLVPHGFFYSTHALKKHDAPPSFFFQMPFWPLFGHLSAHIERVGRLFEGTFIDAEILVVEPASGIPAHEDLVAYESLLWLLAESHLDFHMVDTDLLQQGRIGKGYVQVADLAARVVIVPPMLVVEEPLQDWLVRFETAGGHVMRCQREFEPHLLQAALLRLVQPSLRVQVDGKEAREVLVVRRAAEGRRLWFVLNTCSKTLPAEFDAACELREHSLLPGMPGLLRKEGARYVRQLAPFESCVFEATQVAEQASELPRLRVQVGGPAELELGNANLLRLYYWHMSLMSESGNAGHDSVVPAIPLADQLACGQFAFRPAFEHHFGNSPELAFPEFRVLYRTSFECTYGGLVQLVMEPGSIVGEWSISLNQGRPIGAEYFQSTSAHVRGSLGIEITDLLQQGENTISVEVVTDRPDGGLLNPLYLAGDFGVLLNPPRLVDRKTSGAFERYEENLLPYYAGVIDYTTRFVLEQVPATDHAILDFEYDCLFHEATEVSINGSPYQPVVWQPRRVKTSTSYLSEGENTLSTRVYTTLSRAFEGQWFDYRTHQVRDVGA
jgi:hypothetical protein